MKSKGLCPKKAIARELLERTDPAYSNECCENLQDGQCCKPECVSVRVFDETAIAADMGLYYKFNTDPKTGMPSGCPGFDDEKWVKNLQKDKGVSIIKVEFTKEKLEFINA